MICVKRLHDEAQKNLKTVFEDVINLRSEQTPDWVNGFRDSQKKWIDYRDQECALEAARTQSESLKRLQELSCITTLTQDRINILNSYLENASGIQAERYIFPRWMNALADDYPEIFWRYSNHVRADLDCDEQEEEILAGLRITSPDVVLKDQRAPHETEAVIAVTENPLTGRPQTQLVDFSVFRGNQNQTEDSFCDPDIKISTVPYPHDAEETMPDETEESWRNKCTAALQIHDKVCGNVILYWDGGTYKIFLKNGKRS